MLVLINLLNDILVFLFHFWAFLFDVLVVSIFFFNEIINWSNSLKYRLANMQDREFFWSVQIPLLVFRSTFLIFFNGVLKKLEIVSIKMGSSIDFLIIEISFFLLIVLKHSEMFAGISQLLKPQVNITLSAVWQPLLDLDPWLLIVKYLFTGNKLSLFFFSKIILSTILIAIAIILSYVDKIVNGRVLAFFFYKSIYVLKRLSFKIP